MVNTGAPWYFRFSTKTVRAINIAAALASRRSRRLTPVSGLADEMGAPPCELSSVLKGLVNAGLVRSDGNGSVAWWRDPAGVSLYDIVSAVGERFRLCCCLKGEVASSGLCRQCPMKGLSKSLRSEVVDLLKARRLSELLTA